MQAARAAVRGGVSVVSCVGWHLVQYVPSPQAPKDDSCIFAQELVRPALRFCGRENQVVFTSRDLT